MPVAAQCPSCGNKLSETTVVAGAPHCTACGSWIVGVNGTLGLTSAYGVGDPALTRRRVEADLAVLHEYQMKYTGMMDHCKQKLNWDVGQYAALPQPPHRCPGGAGARGIAAAPALIERLPGKSRVTVVPRPASLWISIWPP